MWLANLLHGPEGALRIAAQQQRGPIAAAAEAEALVAAAWGAPPGSMGSAAGRFMDAFRAFHPQRRQAYSCWNTKTGGWKGGAQGQLTGGVGQRSSWWVGGWGECGCRCAHWWALECSSPSLPGEPAELPLRRCWAPFGHMQQAEVLFEVTMPRGVLRGAGEQLWHPVGPGVSGRAACGRAAGCSSTSPCSRRSSSSKWRCRSRRRRRRSTSRRL